VLRRFIAPGFHRFLAFPHTFHHATRSGGFENGKLVHDAPHVPGHIDNPPQVYFGFPG
jgi:hypothetical protein